MIRITVNNPPKTIPDIYKDSDGLVSLDLFENSRIAITKVIDDFIEAGSIKQDTFKQFKIPITKKNRLVIGDLGNPNALNFNHAKIYEIQLTNGFYSYPVQGLQVVETLEEDCSYSVILFGELNDWYRPLSQLKLNELDLGSDVVDFSFIQQQNNFAIYADNQPPVIAPLVNYGRWFVECNLDVFSNAKSQVVYNNFRWWFSALALIKQAFCQIGYEFISPFMETEKFRKIWLYILDPNFETANQLDVANRDFLAERPTDLVFSSLFFQSATGKQLDGVVNMGFTPINDPGNHYFTRPAGSGFPDERFYGSFYSGGIVGSFSFDGVVNFTPTNAPSLVFPVATNYITLKMTIRKAPKFGFDGQNFLIDKSTVLASQEYIYKSPFVNGASIDFDFNLDTGSVKVYQHEVVFVHVELEADLVDTGGNLFDESYLYPDTTIQAGATFTNNVELQVIEEGDTIEWGKLLNKNYSALDLFKGVLHLHDQKIETDVISKKIFTYPEFKIDCGNQGGIQQGFFKDNQDNVIDITDKIQADSLREKFTNRQLGRDLCLQFQDSTDGYIGGLNLEQEAHSKNIDLGANFQESKQEIKNPFFEPTLNAIDKDISGLIIPAGINAGQKSSHYIPFLWQGEENEGIYPDVGFDYTPRIAIIQANGLWTTLLEPSVTGFDSDTESRYVYEDNILAAHLVLGQIFPDGVKRTNSIDVFDLTDTIIYGSDTVNPNLPDLYDIVYQRAINQAYFGICLEFLIKLNLIDFSAFSFRTKWYLKYCSKAWGEIEIYARVSRIEDFVINDCLTTPVQLIPDNNNFLNC